jgi:uncharacterized protein (TIGR02246 family)
MTLRHIPGLFGAAALAVLSAPGLAAPRDLSDAWPTIQKANADWLPAMKAKDAERLAEAYAEDGVFVLSDGQEIVGHAAIVAFYRKRVERLAEVLDGGIHHDGLTRARDGLVYEWGHGRATTVDKDGHRSTSDGPYLTVWKHAAKGRWEIIRNLVFSAASEDGWPVVEVSLGAALEDHQDGGAFSAFDNLIAAEASLSVGAAGSGVVHVRVDGHHRRALSHQPLGDLSEEGRAVAASDHARLAHEGVDGPRARG